MKSRVPCIFILAVLATTTVGCSSTGSVIQVPTFSAASTPTTATQNPSNGSINVAPSFQEIVKEELRILGGVRPITKEDWEEMEKKGISISKEQGEELDLFYEELSGKKMDNWVGWVVDIYPPDTVGSGYEVSIYMDDPYTKQGKLDDVDVHLFGITHEQIQTITSGTQVDRWNGPWPKVVFSGTIWSVAYSASIASHDAIIAPQP